MDNAQKPAYPITLDESIGETFDGMANHDGLTKRERFAMAAMQGLVNDYGYHKWENMAHDAVKAADALLKELSKETK